MRVDAIAQDVKHDTACHRAHLNGAEEGEPRLKRQRLGLEYAVQRVVIGHGDEADALGEAALDDLAGRPAAVGGGGVDVQVSPHA